MQIIAAKHHQLTNQNFSHNAVQVALTIQQAGFEAYLVGGCVRDSLLGMRPKDFDVATNATPEQVKAIFNRNARIIGRRFKLVHVYFGRELIEIATFRSDHAEQPSHNTDRSAHNEKGRILRDNVYGTRDDDAVRRDFTINALYFDPNSQQIYDYAHGVRDIQQRLIQLIGDPRQRYLEDPVRMLRAIRFAAKLNFAIEEKTAAPIPELAPLLRDIPAARLYDESLKLFLSGYALKTFHALQQFGLFGQLFPGTQLLIEQGSQHAQLLVENALRNTDERIHAGKPVTPAFLFAALIWPDVLARSQNLEAQGMHSIEALQEAAHWAMHNQVQRIAIPKRFTLPAREIWALQQRLGRRQGKRAEALLAHPRFRAAYDFLLLRESAGETTDDLGDWWTHYQVAEPEQRQQMQAALGRAKNGANKAKRRYRKRTN